MFYVARDRRGHRRRCCRLRRLATRCRVSRDVVVTDLVREQARQLKMPGGARASEALARQAREEKWSFEDYAHELFPVEITSCRDSAVRQRLRDARFPETKTLDQFDFAAADG